MNPLFRTPINEETVQNILDLGTGDGACISLPSPIDHLIPHKRQDEK